MNTIACLPPLELPLPPRRHQMTVHVTAGTDSMSGYTCPLSYLLIVPSKIIPVFLQSRPQRKCIAVSRGDL